MEKDNIKKRESDGEAIDLMHILSVLWKRAWIIVLCGILAAACAFSWVTFTVAPKYSSSVMMYVNNSLSVGNISVAQISLSRSLVDTYIVILNNRTTLNKVIENTGLNYTYGQLLGMVNIGSVNGTEVIRVTVTAENPYDAQILANEIAVVLPERVSQIIDGTSVQIVDRAVVSTAKVSPNITKYTAMGMLLGVAAACAVLIIIDLLDSVIRNEEYILQNYDLPILAKIPDLLSDGTSHYGYYRSGTASGQREKKE